MYVAVIVLLLTKDRYNFPSTFPNIFFAIGNSGGKCVCLDRSMSEIIGKNIYRIS